MQELGSGTDASEPPPVLSLLSKLLQIGTCHGCVAVTSPTVVNCEAERPAEVAKPTGSVSADISELMSEAVNMAIKIQVAGRRS